MSADRDGDAPGDAPDDAPDAAIKKMASDYVDLWEQQMRTLAKDETLAETMAQTLQLMNAGAANVAAMMQSYADEKAGESEENHARNAGDADPQAAAPAPDDADVDLRAIARRLAAFEERLARLEGLLEPKSKRPKRGSS